MKCSGALDLMLKRSPAALFVRTVLPRSVVKLRIRAWTGSLVMLAFVGRFRTVREGDCGDEMLRRLIYFGHQYYAPRLSLNSA